MKSITVSELDALVDQFQGEGLMVSCYADLGIVAGFQSAWQGPFKASRHTVKESLSRDERAWQECRANLTRIQKALEAPEMQHAKGAAVFSAQQRNFFRVFPLDVRVDNELVVHRAPWLVPLLQVLHQRADYLVVHTNTHRGRLYTANLGGAQLLEEIEEAVPKRHRSTPERRDRQQDLARHRQNQVLHYQKKLVDHVDRLWEAQSFRGILLLGEHPITEAIRQRLPVHLADRVLDTLNCGWNETSDVFAGRIHNWIRQRMQVREKQHLDQFKAHLAEGYSVAIGAEQVLEALQQGKIGPRGHGYLLLGPDSREVIARCTSCRCLLVDVPTTCPRCHSPCAEASLWEELLLLALRHDVVVHFAQADEDLARCGNLVAILPGRELQRQTFGVARVS